MRNLAILTFCILAITHGPTMAQSVEPTSGDGTEKSFDDMNLEELLSVKVSVATQSGSSTTRQAPAIVTLVTSEEIASSGARDLLDVLSLVPGFSPALDTQGVVNFGIRGLWAHEGKTLLMIDGLTVNEILYGTTQMGHDFPVELIDRVEIIRGPGSVVYGGFGELAVINVITKGASELNGVSLNATHGQMTRGPGRSNASIAYAKETPDWSVSAWVFKGQGQRSDQDYTDSQSRTYNLSGKSDLNPTTVNLGFRVGDFSVRALSSSYNTKIGDAYGKNTLAPIDNNFTSQVISAKYNKQFSPILTVVPELTYSHFEPWKNLTDDPLVANLRYNRLAQRSELKISSIWRLSEKFKLTAGIGAFEDKAQDKVGNFTITGNNRWVSDEQYVFAEVNGDFSSIQSIFGARYETNTKFGNSTVPRLGVVKAWNNLHLKALYSSGFRTPTIQNIDSNSAIKSETTNVAEFEAGYRVSEKVFLTANLFDIRMNQPIVYDSVNSADAYYNFDATGSRGIEFETRYKDPATSLTLGYSFYQARGNQVTKYQIPNQENLLLAFPAQKIVLAATHRLPSNFRLSANAIWFSSRYGYDGDSTVLTEYPAQTLIAAKITKEKLFLNGLSMGFAVQNATDQPVRYIQPYNGGHNPLPGPSRELIVTLNYRSDI